MLESVDLIVLPEISTVPNVCVVPEPVMLTPDILPDDDRPNRCECCGAGMCPSHIVAMKYHDNWMDYPLKFRQQRGEMIDNVDVRLHYQNCDDLVQIFDLEASLMSAQATIFKLLKIF